ncbi:uncharacterized protein LOC131234413 [Magnolia sinica]|uniref:uncharacterized protein LOC131234413 n=1 Tax=Magnolia sinica TaxID=86752 RepID=UPI002658FDAE|nr:uncharacterized protein LOC131234413 [Magnolia sinica]
MAAAEEESDSPEKRFHTIMDKLFHAPGAKRPPSSSSPSTSAGIRSLGGKKRLRSNPVSIPEPNSRRDLVDANSSRRTLAVLGPSQVGVPVCRPWDRGDLLRRLATFKSMTWFGKPKVVSPVNCAKRGWVNVEMDIIACEACGSRLLFSTPSSWTQLQVEKAAAVFSLKLDSGHKVLCPWIDNACDEGLALFPPTPAPALIQGYRDRSSALLQLSALPVISSSAVDYMKSPQLESFLAQPPHPVCSLDDGIQPSGSSRSEALNESEALSAKLYHQAHKLISLCGWEPRFLPYVVDCEDRSIKSVKDSDSSPRVIGRQNPSIFVYPSSGSDEAARVKENSPTLGEHQPDPASVVLDCRFCGACVGLWAFSTVPRPLELFRLIKSVEINHQKDSSNGGDNNFSHMIEAPNTVCNSSAVSKDRALSLNLTIAGGPRPTKQNFKATVTLPIISRHLRAGLCSNSVARNREPSDVLSIDLEDHIDRTHTGQVVLSEEAGTLKRKRNEDELCIARDSSSDAQCHLNGKSDRVERSLINEEMNADISSEERHSNEQGLPTMHAENVQNVPQDSGRNDALVEDAEIAGAVTAERGATVSQVGECFPTTPIANGAGGYDGISEENLAALAAYDSNQKDIDFCVADILQWIQDPQDGLNDSSHIGSHSEAKATADGTHDMDFRKGDEDSDFQSSADGQPNNQMVVGVTEMVQSSVSNEILAAHGPGNDLKLVQWDKKMEFDPIRQHRHFCPWVASTDGTSMPGWKQTLSALDHLKESPLALREDSPSALSICEVDDPIASVRKLFMSPSEKRTKMAHQSS